MGGMLERAGAWLAAPMARGMPMNSKRCGANPCWFLALVGVLLAARFASGSAQAGPPLASLTIPETNLPAGCRLRSPSENVPPMVDPFPTNPWIGADRRLVIAVREDVDGMLRLPDAPPPTRAEQARLKERWVADVVEAYRAVYLDGGGLIWVSALRFNDARSANGDAWSERRIVRGAIVVSIAGSPTSACQRAIDAYLRALK